MRLEKNYSVLKIYMLNGYHIEIIDEDRKEYLYTISCISVQKLVLEKLFAFFSRIYYTIMKSIEINVDTLVVF